MQNLAFVLRICEVYIRIENLSQIVSGKALRALRSHLFAEFYASRIGFTSGFWRSRRFYICFKIWRAVRFERKILVHLALQKITQNHRMVAVLVFRSV